MRPSFIPPFLQAIPMILLTVALGGMQVLIGGTRMAFSLPIYALLGVVGFLAALSPRQGRAVSDRVCLWSSAIFFGYVLVRAWSSPVWYLARSDTLSVLGGLVVYLSVALVFTNARGRMAILFFLLVVALVQVAVGAIQFRDGNNFMLIPFLQRYDYGRRASGFYICPNHFAGMLEVLGGFAVSFVCWSRWPVWLKLLLAYAGLACYGGLLLSGSRGGYLSAAFSLGVVVTLAVIAIRAADRMVFWRVLGAGLVVLLLLGAGVFWGFSKSNYLNDRARQIWETNNIRVDLWRAAVAQWELRPLLGTGSGTYLYYGRRFRSERVQLDPVEAHNDYLQLLAEDGAIGGTAFLAFLGTHLVRGVAAFQSFGRGRLTALSRVQSNRLALNLGALGAVAAYLVHSIFDFNLHVPANLLLLAFVFGVLANPGSARAGEDEPRLSFSPARFVLFLLALLLLGVACRYAPGEENAERARVALRDGRYTEARRWALSAVAYDSQNPEAWFYIGESRVREAEEIAEPRARASFYRAACDPISRAQELAPNDERYLIALGRVYDAIGRFAEAEWMFGRALAWDPKSHVAQQSYAAHLQHWHDGIVPARREAAKLPPKAAPLPEKAEAPSE